MLYIDPWPLGGGEGGWRMLTHNVCVGCLALFWSAWWDRTLRDFYKTSGVEAHRAVIGGRCFEWFVIFNHILMILHMNPYDVLKSAYVGMHLSWASQVTSGERKGTAGGALLIVPWCCIFDHGKKGVKQKKMPHFSMQLQPCLLQVSLAVLRLVQAGCSC